MEHQPDLKLPGAAVDPETFRRVWDRVMSGRSGPIEPAPLPQPVPRPHTPAPAPPFVPPAPPTPVPAPPPVPTDEGVLRGLMDLLEEGLAADDDLSRLARPGSTLPPRLRNGHRKAMGRLSAAHFLLTGHRYRPGPFHPLPGSGSVELALRRQYLWERRWIAALQGAAEETADPVLRELFRELTREGNLRLREVREALAAQ